MFHKESFSQQTCNKPELRINLYSPQKFTNFRKWSLGWIIVLMANLEHIERLRKGLKLWRNWRYDNPDVLPDLTSVDLSGAGLNGADVTGAVMDGTVFAGTNLSGVV